MRPRRKLREDRLVASDEELYPENAVAAQRFDDFASLVPGRVERALSKRGRLPAGPVIARFLVTADRRAEQDAVLRRDRQQRDLAVELHEFLDDDARAVAPHLLDRMVPRGADFLLGFCGALPFARARHDRLDDARQTDLASR